MLRLYDLDSIKLLFEVELYYGLKSQYKRRSDVFHTFEYPRGVIGFLFKSKSDADLMALKI